MPLTIKPASGSGSATLISVSGTTTNDTLTLPAKTGNIITSADSGTVTQAMLASNVSGNGPAFSAYQSSAQTPSATTWTKVQLQTEEYDTASCFDNATNYRFTPNVAGYYHFTGCAGPTGSSTSSLCSIYKNGTLVRYGSISQAVTSPATGSTTIAGADIYMNGSTDYVEFYVYLSASVALNTGASFTYFQGFLARSA